MAERRTIGQILIGFGRISEEDVERALHYQQDHGGYFGEALLALGMVTQEELEWSLASQFDLPYVFPDVDSIDLEAAQLVTPEWALARLTLPIMKTADSVTVIVDSPIKTDAVDELQRRTGLRIELALASAAKIRELVRQVYSRIGEGEDDRELEPIGFSEWLLGAIERGSRRFGVSLRGHRAIGWFEDRGAMRRRPLTSGWRSDLLERLLPSVPPPGEGLPGGGVGWEALLTVREVALPVEVSVLQTPAGEEILFSPFEERARILERFSAPPAAVLSEVQLLVRSGAARFGVTSTSPELVHEILPFLPHLLLDPTWRTVHLYSGTRVEEGVFSLQPPPPGPSRDSFLESLRGFHFDAVTADLEEEVTGDWLAGVLSVAANAFVPWHEGIEQRVAEQAGIRWELGVRRTDGGRVEWNLTPLRG